MTPRGLRSATPPRSPLALLALPVLALGLGACDDDGDTPIEVVEPTTFQLRIESVAQPHDFIESGVFDTPAGSGSAGPAMPGAAYEMTFGAAPGDRLHFATMFVPSNDFFYAPDGEGIALYDGDGMPMSGDVTDQVRLWDAGTEVNQEPGLGPDQAPFQSGPDQGAADPDDSVRGAPDAFGNLPAVEDVVEVVLTPLGRGRFHLRIANVSDAATLSTSDGETRPVILAPGAFAVGGVEDALFTVGEPAPENGLEAMAEDGAAGPLGESLGTRTGLSTPVSPGVWAVHEAPGAIFTAGAVDAGEGLEAIAEDGDPSILAPVLATRADTSGVFDTPEGAGSPGPVGPGSAYVVEFEAEPGDRLSFVTMFIQSNDLFYAPADAGIGLFNGNGTPVSGDVTGMVFLFDAGTESNAQPGVGPYQAPRQPGPDTGPEETEMVEPVNDGYVYPDTESILRVTLTPLG